MFDGEVVSESGVGRMVNGNRVNFATFLWPLPLCLVNQPWWRQSRSEQK